MIRNCWVFGQTRILEGGTLWNVGLLLRQLVCVRFATREPYDPLCVTSTGDWRGMGDGVCWLR